MPTVHVAEFCTKCTDVVHPHPGNNELDRQEGMTTDELARQLQVYGDNLVPSMCACVSAVDRLTPKNGQAS